MLKQSNLLQEITGEIGSFISNIDFHITEDMFTIPAGACPLTHSRQLDNFFGFQIPKIERKLLKKYRGYDQKADLSSRRNHLEGSETWIGLHPQVLQTPYPEIHSFLNILKSFTPETIVDLGAGYGRMAIVLSQVIPDSKFIGYELMDVRREEGERVLNNLGLKNFTLKKQNIIEEGFKIPTADVYFIYDFSDPLDLRVILRKLSKKMETDKFFLVARGKGIRSLIQNKFKEFYALNDAIHDEKWSIYNLT